MSTEITYWYHPESESYWIHDPSKDQPLNGDSAEVALSAQLSEQEFITKRIAQIDEDPRHTLPEGISGVIKFAVQWPGDAISGMLYYDVHKRFPNGYPINTSAMIGREPGGIFCTKNNKYIVELIEPSREAAIG